MDSLRCRRRRLPLRRRPVELSHAWEFGKSGPQSRARGKRGDDATDTFRPERAPHVGDRAVQHCLLWSAMVVNAGDGAADRYFPPPCRRNNCGPGGFRWSNGRSRFSIYRREAAESWSRLWSRVQPRRFLSCDRVYCDLHRHPNHSTSRSHPKFRSTNTGCRLSIIMKIKEIRTRVIQWRGKTVSLPPHFCTNPMDLLSLPQSSMSTFTFHGWLIVEVFTDDGLVGIGNAALAPLVTKQVIDLYLKPLLIGSDAWDIEFLWQHMYRKTMAFGRKRIGMVEISAVDIALWDLMGKSAKQPVFRLLGGRTKQRIPVYASRLYSTPLDELARESKKYKDEGYKAMKLRFGWGPVDGAEGMQKNVALVRTVRETVGDGIDIMADAYMGWSLDYAKRMLPLLEPFHLRWLEEPVIPDDIHGYAELKRFGRIPIAGGEHEHTLFGFRELIEARAVDYIQFDTNRVGGLTQARKIAALAEAHKIPVIPHAGQMHNYHVVMASLNSPMAEFSPPVDVEVGNELFWYIFKGEPTPKDGFIDLDENVPGLGLTVDEEGLKKFEITE